MSKKICLSLVITVCFAGLLSADIPFYVKQEQVQLPGRSIEVRIQGESGPLAFTVYKVLKPESFLAGQKDIHKLQIEDSPIRKRLNRAIQLSTFGNKPVIHGSTVDIPQSKLDFRYVKSFEKKAAETSESSFDGYLPVSLSVKEPGLYLVEAVKENYITYSLALCSNLAIITRRSGDRVLVYAVDRQSGKPRAGAKVWAYRMGKLICGGTTDANGVFVTNAPYSPRLLIVARDGENFTAGDPAFFPSLVDCYKGYLFTERPLYLPGEKVFFKGVVRKSERGEYLLPKDEIDSVEYKVFDARGSEINSGKVALTKEATFAGEFTLPSSFGMGNCVLKAKYGRHEFRSEFRAEKFKKPKFTVKVKPGKKAMVVGGKAKYTISGRYYAGGELEKAEIRYQLYRSRFYQPLFKDTGLAGFYSEGEYKSFKSELIDSGKAELSGGKCKLSFDTAKSDFSYHMRLKVFVIDPSHNTGGGSGTVSVSPAGTKMDLLTNKDLYAVEDQIQMTIKAEDLAKRPVSVDFKVDLVRKGRQYPKGGHAGLPGEIPGMRGSNVAAKKFYTTTGKTGANGIAIIEAPAIEAGEVDVILNAKDKDGNAVKVIKTVWVENGKAPVLYSGRLARLVADKKAYRVGDIARVMVILPMKGVSPLITVEGVDLLDYRVEHFTNNAGVIDIPISEKMTPNAYVRVSAVYKNGFVESEKMLVTPPLQKMLKVAVRTDKPAYKPGEKAVFEISASDYEGKAVSTDLAVSVVDSSLYSLAPDGNAPLHRFFYPLRRSNVGSSSTIVQLSYDYARETSRIPVEKKPKPPVLAKKMAMATGDDNGENPGGALMEEEPMEREMAVSLDDASADGPRPTTAIEPSRTPAPREEATGRALAEKKKDKANTPAEEKTSERKLFATTAAWFAFVRTDAKGRAKVEFVWPDNLTDWKISARAIDGNTRVGELVTRVSTRKPVMAAVNWPAFLVEQDRLQLQVSARNASGKTHKMKLKLKASGGAKLAKKLSVSAKVKSGKWLRASTQLSAVGVEQAVLRVSVKAGKHRDAERRAFPVLAHGILQSQGLSGTLAHRESRLPGSHFRLPENAGHAALTVRITPGYVAAIQESLDMLIEYPYGCTEQTMSRFMPDLVATEALQNLNLKSPLPKPELKRYVKAGVSRLHQLQNKDGGWGWWQDSSHPMLSAYVLSGLGRARTLGYDVNDDLLQRGIAFATRTLNSGVLGYSEKAYLLYALSLNEKMPEMSIDKLFDDEQRLKADPYTLALLALTLAGQKRYAEAKIIITELAEHSQMAGDSGIYWGKTEAHRWDKNAVEVTAMVVRAFVAADPGQGLIAPALDWLMSQRKESGWNSTKDTAEIVLTLCAYLSQKKLNLCAGEQVIVEVNGVQKKLTVDQKTVSTVFAPQLKSGFNDVTIYCKTPGRFFYSAYLSYFSRDYPLSASSSGLTVKRDYRLLSEGKSGEKVRHGTVMPDVLTPGQMVMVTLTLEVPRNLDFVMLEDYIPATAQVVQDDRNIEVEGNVKPIWDHREFHFEKTVFFFTRLSAGTYTMRYFFRPVLGGDFHALPAVASLMYYPEIRGNSTEATFSVK